MKKRIVILGAGESGVGSAILAQKMGFDVFVSDFSAIKEEYKAILDKKNIAYEEKNHSTQLVLSADEIIKSPGIPDKAPIIQLVLQKEIPVISEIEFAGRYTKAKKICITGSNGKTTTTSLIYFMLKEAGLNVGLAGNIGKSFAWQVAENDFDLYVIELSSFQLDNMYNFNADIAILLNITPDHLDRYHYNFQYYIDAKLRITQNMGKNNYLVYCAEDQNIANEILKMDLDKQTNLIPFSLTQRVDKGAFCIDNEFNVLINNDELKMDINEILIQGKHNAYNSMAAAITGRLMDISKEEIRKCLMSFSGVEHRLEKVCKVKGVQYINDSKATNVNSTWYALESMKTPVVLILGGVDKGNDYSEIEQLVKDKVKVLVCLGKDNAKLLKFFEGKVTEIVDTNSMEGCIQACYYFAAEGDTVLLSPACASFDLFENYEDRGQQFKKLVKDL